MNKPAMQSAVAVPFNNPATRYINIYAPTDIALVLHDLGTLTRDTSHIDSWYLCVDPRFDFAEVLAYCQALAAEHSAGTQSPNDYSDDELPF